MVVICVHIFTVLPRPFHFSAKLSERNNKETIWPVKVMLTGMFM